jgi:hypothetical protein
LPLWPARLIGFCKTHTASCVKSRVNPGRLFLGFLPAMFGADGGLGSVVKAVERIRNEVDSILEGYLEEAVQILGSTFRIGVAGDAVSSLQDWISCFDVDALVRRDDLRMTDRAILRTARVLF